MNKPYILLYELSLLIIWKTNPKNKPNNIIN